MPSAPYQYPTVAPAQTYNGLAIASMVVGIVWLYWVGSVLAVIFGFIALNQIRQRNESGRGMAIAGIVLGFVGIGVLIAVGVIAAVVANNNNFNNGAVILRSLL